MRPWPVRLAAGGTPLGPCRNAPLLLTVACFLAAPAVAAPNRALPPRVQDFVLQRVDANQISMAVTNFGHLAFDVFNGSAGLEYPSGSGKTAVFASGLWMGALSSGQLRAAVAEYGSEYRPGSADSGAAENPLDPALVVHKLRRVYEDTATRDSALAAYVAGAVSRGAPPVGVQSDGSLDIVGDQMLWAVYNDLDPDAHQSPEGGTLPLGVEVQQTVYAFDRPGALGRTVFVSFKIVNRTLSPLTDLYLALWSDPDLGGFTDDLVGCDPARSLGFCYNSTNNDAVYGTTPPAVGFDLLKVANLSTGESLAATSFIKYINGTDPQSAGETYAFLRGLMRDGTPIVDPSTGQPTTFMHAGDPVAGTGWLDSVPSDRRALLCSGPYALQPEQTLQLDAAIVIGQGGDRLASITALRADDAEVQQAFDDGFQTCDPVAMGFDFTPTTLNLRSMGRWVNGFLEPPPPYRPSDIDVSSIRLNGVVAVDPAAASAVGDHDGNGIQDLKVKFDRGEVQAVLPAGNSVPITVTGTVAGQCFEGDTLVRTLHPKLSSPDSGDVFTPGLITPIQWQTPPGANPRWVATLSSLDGGESWQLVARYLPNDGSSSWEVPYVSTDRARVAVVLVEESDESGEDVQGLVGMSPSFRIGTATGVTPERSGLGLLGTVPNPARGALPLVFRLPDGAPATLALHDLAGRLMWALEVGSLGPGTHTVIVPGADALPAGVYLARVRHGREERVARVVLMH